MSMKTYSELVKFDSYLERFNYLKLDGKIGEATFGADRYFNQIFYNSDEWRKTRNRVIIRDRGCDLGCQGYEIFKYALIHHINPITIEQILDRDPLLFDMENLITTSKSTHNAIHYGDETLLTIGPTIRFQGDTKLW